MISMRSGSVLRQHKILLISLLTLAACGSKKGGSKAASITVNGDTVIVAPYATLKARLKTMVTGSGAYSQELVSGATVKAIPTQYAEVTPPFSGRVTKVHLRLGMKTQAGTPLFEMISPDFMESQKTYFQAKAAYQNAGRTLQRQQDLKANGVGAAKDLEEAETDYEVKEKEYQNALAALKLFNTDVRSLVLGQPLVVRSPIAGEVIENDVVLGHYIKADDPPHAKVAALDKVWVTGMVKEKDIHLIHNLKRATVSLPVFPGRELTGTIYHINEMMDEDTRSVNVLVACDNPDHTLKPGMYATVTFATEPRTGRFIPAKAVLQFNDKSYVWLQAGKDRYIKRYVTTGITNQGNIQILSGLTDGDIVISEGAYYLSDAQ